MATDWSLTRTQYVRSESRNPIDKTGRANTHEVGAPRATIGIESKPLQEMFGGEGTEAETIDEMIMRTAAGGGNTRPILGAWSLNGLYTNYDATERMHEWNWPTLGKGDLFIDIVRYLYLAVVGQSVGFLR